MEHTSSSKKRMVVRRCLRRRSTSSHVQEGKQGSPSPGIHIPSHHSSGSLRVLRAREKLASVKRATCSTSSIPSNPPSPFVGCIPTRTIGPAGLSLRFIRCLRHHCSLCLLQVRRRALCPSWSRIRPNSFFCRKYWAPIELEPFIDTCHSVRASGEVTN
jgi:hypothetical protein